MLAKLAKERPMTIDLPEEFLALCQRDGITPKELLQGFIADLSALPGSHGSDEREHTGRYYDRCGYPYRWGHP
jgi:hypothetical protein